MAFTIDKFRLVQIFPSDDDGGLYVEPWQAAGSLEQPELNPTNMVIGVTMTQSDLYEHVAVMTRGEIRNVAEQNGELWSVGVQLWGVDNDGSMTMTRPVAPNRQIYVGTVIQGGEEQLHTVDVDVRILPGVGELGGVDRQTPVDRDVLIYRADTFVWEPRQLWKSVDASTTYTVDQHDYLVRCDATSAPFTVTLPQANTVVGMVVHVKKVDVSAHFVTVDANGSELIDGELTFDLELQGESLMLQCDGVSWAVI